MGDAEIWTLSVGAAGRRDCYRRIVSISIINNTLTLTSPTTRILTPPGLLQWRATRPPSNRWRKVAISLSNNAIDAAVGVNIITNTVLAYIDSSNVDTTSEATSA